MAQLNYNHLHYFWVVATLGSIVEASRALHLTPQTISGQIRTLEHRVGSRLFRKQGRRIELTEMGQLVRSYAEPMFHLGAELADVLKAGDTQNSGSLKIGIASSVPRALACSFVNAARGVEPWLVCLATTVTGLASELKARNLDLALADGPVGTADTAETASHLIGECGTTILGGRRYVERYRRSFPSTLDGAAFLLPPRRSRLRRPLSRWLGSRKLAPAVVSEVENPELMAGLSEAGDALFAVPTALAADMEERYAVATVGDIPELTQQFYLIASNGYGETESLREIVRLAREQFALLATHKRAHEVVDAAVARLGSKRPAGGVQELASRYWNGEPAFTADGGNAA